MTYSLPYDAEEVRDLIDTAIAYIGPLVASEIRTEWIDGSNTTNYVGEWSLAFEGLCVSVSHYNLPISREMYDLLAEIGTKMHYKNTELWEKLQVCIHTSKSA